MPVLGVLLPKLARCPSGWRAFVVSEGIKGPSARRIFAVYPRCSLFELVYGGVKIPARMARKKARAMNPGRSRHRRKLWQAEAATKLTTCEPSLT